jgi:signal transduction histidine kinase
VLRKILHWSLLVVAILLWLVASWGVHQENKGRKPQEISAAVAEDLQQRSKQAEELGEHAADVIRWMSGTASAAFSEWIREQPYFLFAHFGDSLTAWSTNAVVPPQAIKDSGGLYHLGNGSYYGYDIHSSWIPAGYRLSVLLPIAEQYHFNNEYLQPRFIATPTIDPHVPVADTAVAGAAPLLAPDGHRIGWVHPPPAGDLPESPADWIVWCWLLSLVLFAAWLHGWFSILALRVGTLAGAALTITVAAGIRILLMLYGPPFRIGETDLFSPTLYASSTLLPSLGDLLLHVLALIWILLFVAPRLRYASLHRLGPAWLRLIVAFLLSVGLYTIGRGFIKLVRSLVLDSLIPFDRAHLSSLDRSALAGLLITGLLMSILLILTRMVRNALLSLVPSFLQQATSLAVGALLFWVIYRNDLLIPVCSITALWLSVNILGQHVGKMRESANLFRVANIFWSMAHCLLLALLIQHFERQREGAVRRHFAEHIASRHDDAMEYNFGQNLTLIRTDTALQRFYAHPTLNGRNALDERLTSLYLGNALAGYQAQIYLYSADERPLLNRDTTSLETFYQISKSSVPSRTASDLYYREGTTDDHIYLALMPVEDSLGNLLGSIAIDLEQKKIVAETVLPELLQPATVNQAEKAAGYSYAIYAGGRLVAQTSDYPFPFYIAHDTSRNPYRERKGNDASTLTYSPDAYRSVSVWRRFNTVSETITLFSYLLLLRFILLAMGAVYRQAGQWLDHPEEAMRQIRGIGLRRRLHLYIMGIVALSFIGIGIVTVIFLRQQYDASGKTSRQAMMQVVSRAIQQWVKDRGSDNNIYDWQAAAVSPDFGHFLSGLAASQRIDINLFDASGHLINTTQQAIYDQDLLAPVMRYNVLREFATGPRSLITEVEQIGALQYQSCYTPLRAEGGNIAAYLNVPLFYAQREIEEQISNVVVTLINLYAAALLLSALLAYFITRWVTRAFDLIIRQFGQLNLHQNELLQWPYDDEVGVLVKEYNKMVRKVEESVALLARNEREGAFKEMARQVAHEIKNPLTPMSLYVQRLQRAIASGEPDAMDLARRVSDSLLEQINNLSVIATEFGEFARIGSARPEAIELSELLCNVAEPFAADTSMEISCETPPEPLQVMADRSQLVRIITNLMKNATQAIPESRKGRIQVRLIKEQGYAVLTVADNGSGISAETQEKLFTPYFTTKSSGTGIGLAMTRQMVEAWSGTISYETKLDEGTTFSIRLPLIDVIR